MKTIPKNEALNQVVERAEKRHNDEFIRQQIELRRQSTLPSRFVLSLPLSATVLASKF